MRKITNTLNLLFFLFFSLHISIQAASNKNNTKSVIFDNEINLNSSDVFSVDQISTTETKSWLYTTEKAGNYQIGYAWIWVKGVDKTVDFEIKIGTEVVKKFTAKSEIAPYRFETRLENLSIGEVVRITATPNDGASYKLNYKIAYASFCRTYILRLVLRVILLQLLISWLDF